MSVPKPTICTALLSLLASSPASAQIINGDAETGDLQGWSASSAMVATVSQQSQSSGVVHPAEGSHFFSLARQPGSTASLTQSGDLPTGFTCLKLSGQFQSERLTTPDGDDYGEVVLAVLDQGGTTLAEASSGALVAAKTLQWEAFSVTLSAPPGAVTWQVRLDGHLRYGSYVNVFYDGLALELREGDASFATWAEIHIADAATRGAADDPDGDRIVNLAEFATGLNPEIADSLQDAIWLTRGSDVSPTDVDVFFRESTLACGLTIRVEHTASLLEPFAQRLARGPYVVGSGEGYLVKQLRFSDLDTAAGFFQLVVAQE